MTRRIYLLFVALCLTACGVNTVEPQLPATVPIATQPDQAQITPLPTNVNTYQTAALSAWRLWNPSDPGLPSLIQPDGEFYRLDSAWSIAEITYSDKWSGMGTPRIDFSTVRANNGNYQRDDGSVVPAAQVEALMQAVGQLHPNVGDTWWIPGTDNYPFRELTLRGQDGNTVEVWSSSTSNRGFAPWNILYNGRYYTQLDGSLAQPLSALFGLDWKLDVLQSGQSRDEVYVEAKGAFYQRGHATEGFSPLDVEFDLVADAITGTLTLPYATGSVDKEPPTLTQDLSDMRLNQPDGTIVMCALRKLSLVETNGLPKMSFQCPLTLGQIGERFRLPSSIEYLDATGQAKTLHGVFTGEWGAPYDYDLQPLPTALAQVLTTHASVTPLLQDHVLIGADYAAKHSLTNPANDIYEGTITLLGQTEIAGQAVRYQISTPFRIAGSSLSAWTLDRAALDAMLATIRPHPLTQRVLQEAPDAVISLWYSAALPEPMLEGMSNSGWFDYEAELRSCGADQGGTFPTQAQPTALFAFNYDGSLPYDNHRFFIRDGHINVMWLNIGWDSTVFLKTLMPQELVVGTQLHLGIIWLSRYKYGGQEIPSSVDVLILEQASLQDLAVYEQTIKALGGQVDNSALFIELADKGIAVGDDGVLHVVACP